MSTNSATPGDDELAAILAKTFAHHWDERKNAVAELASYLSRPEAYERVVACLDDENIAVIEEAERALITGCGAHGLLAVLRAMSSNEDNASYHMHDEIMTMWLDGMPIVELLEEVRRSSPGHAIAEAVRGLLDEMRAR